MGEPVNPMHDELRELLDAAIGEPPKRVSAEAVRRLAIRRRLARAGFAGAAVAVAAGLAITLSAGTFGGVHPQMVASSGGSAARPRFYLAQSGPGNGLAVRATATGRITARVAVPVPNARCGSGNVGIAAAGRGQAFFMTCVVATSSPATSITTSIYRFGVNGSGRITGYTLVKGGVLKNAWPSYLAASPDGSAVAVEVLRPSPSGGIKTNAVPAGIYVINTRTGDRELLRSGADVPGALQYAGASSISFTRDRTELVVAEARCRRTGNLAQCNGHANMQVRAYQLSWHGGSLEAGRVLLNQASLKPAGTALVGAFVTPDGSALNTLLLTCPRHGACLLTVVRDIVGTREPWDVLYRTRTGTRFEGAFIRFFGTDPSGRFLLLDAGAGTARVNGWIDHGKLVRLLPADGNAVTAEAW